jgi:peptidoglycan/LPS O-acetylase OafA/YrhL
MTASPTRLDGLTSLRFFAAMMIVIYHSNALFGLTPGHFVLAQGVSFFYVLSGFILTMVYPSLDDAAARRGFWRARFARIWPAYLAALLLGAWLLGYRWKTGPALAYVGMVQAWIPRPEYYFAYNAPGWSVSVEFFFYLLFPVLVHAWERTWKWKLPVVAALAVGMMLLSNQVAGPGATVTSTGLLVVNPLARLFEFVLGMSVARAWRARPATTGFGVATALELAALGACVLSMRWSQPIASWLLSTPLGGGGSVWFSVAGSAPAFAALVYVVAHGRGALSRVLSLKPLVLLGEVSYSIYLLHQTLLLAYTPHADDVPVVPPWAQGAIFLVVLVLVSYLVWHFVEMPMRRWIVGRQRLHGTAVALQAPSERRVWTRRPVLAALATAALLGGINASFYKPQRVVLAPVLPDPRPLVSASCNLENVGQQVFAGNTPLVIEGREAQQLGGWVLSQFSNRPGAPATVRITSADGRLGWEGRIVTWVYRGDVLKARSVAGGGNVGFLLMLDLSALPPGRYGVAVGIEEGGKRFLCNHGRRIEVPATP